MKEHPDIYAFYITSPSYEGFVVDYQKIKETAGEALIIVDEAHGAYCYISNQMKYGALLDGADASVMSIHKTLGGISGTAFINVSKSSRLAAAKVR